MWNDVAQVHAFYQSRLGAFARRVAGQRVRAIWPDVRGMRVLGIGYASPYLSAFVGEAERVVSVAPAPQGVLPWPTEGAGLTTLCDEAALPFPDLSFDRVVLCHALESTEQLRPMMRDIWRVLDSGGRILVMVPNRRGLWARSERTPFGHGRPYSSRQLDRLLQETMFTPLSLARAMWYPPIRSRMMLSLAPMWEKVGEKTMSHFSGVLIKEATKEIYAPQAVSLAKKQAYAVSSANGMPFQSR